MHVTLFGIVMEIKFSQYANVPPSIHVNPLGMFIEIKPEQLEKALFPIFVTILTGITRR